MDSLANDVGGRTASVGIGGRADQDQRRVGENIVANLRQIAGGHAGPKDLGKLALGAFRHGSDPARFADRGPHHISGGVGDQELDCCRAQAFMLGL